MGIRGSTLEDKVQLCDLELHRFSLWRRPQFEAMWRRFKDSGLGFALDRDRLRLVLAQNGGVAARAGPVAEGKVAGTSLDDPLLKLFPLFDTDANDLIDAYDMWARQKKFEIIFCSSDQTEEEYRDYLGEMPWKVRSIDHVTPAFCLTTAVFRRCRTKTRGYGSSPTCTRSAEFPRW